MKRKTRRKKSSAKRGPPRQKELLDQPRIFCTECGVELENFCFSRGVDDVKAIKKTLAQCRKKGKFVGEFCSKLFVADTQDIEVLEDDE
jgi:hypothetical protein